MADEEEPVEVEGSLACFGEPLTTSGRSMPVPAHEYSFHISQSTQEQQPREVIAECDEWGGPATTDSVAIDSVSWAGSVNDYYAVQGVTSVDLVHSIGYY